jgi:uncharacterized membrane protein
MGSDPLRHHREHGALSSAWGDDRFGRSAERLARLFGTPRYIIGQSLIVAVWILVNAAGIALRWDPYPFILLNLAFSTQAAYAAPLILLAQNRQADREKAGASADAAHREELAAGQQELLAAIKDQIDPETPGGVAEILERLDALGERFETALKTLQTPGG